MRLRLAGAFAALALTGAAVAGEIAGTAPSYGPRAVAVVPNEAAIVQRLWSPGLDAGYDPQGLTVADGMVLVAAYRSDRLAVHRGPCRVFRLDPDSGATTGTLDVPDPCGHAGGLAAGGDGMLYVADTNTLFATPLAAAFAPEGGRFRRFPVGDGLSGGLAAAASDGIWIGTYREHEPGRLYRFSSATLASLRDSEALTGDRAAETLPIPDHAQGAAFGAGALWVARSDTGWGTLDRLDPATGALQHRYAVAPGIEGVGFDASGRLWAVSEAGARHFYHHPFAGLIEPFYPLVFTLDLSRLR